MSFKECIYVKYTALFPAFLGVVVMCCMRIGSIKDNKKGAVKKQPE